MEYAKRKLAPELKKIKLSLNNDFAMGGKSLRSFFSKIPPTKVKPNNVSAIVMYSKIGKSFGAKSITLSAVKKTQKPMQSIISRPKEKPRKKSFHDFLNSAMIFLISLIVPIILSPLMNNQIYE